MAARPPQRSCLGCGVTKDKGDLLRYVLGPDKVLVPDLKGKLPGRGAYTCTSGTCLRQAVKRKRFNASFHDQLQPVDADRLLEGIRSHLLERIAGYLALATKAGKVSSGSDAVTAALKADKAGLLIVATDTAHESRNKAAFLAQAVGTPVMELFDKERLGALIGKEYRSVAVVESGGFITPLLREYEAYRNFFGGEVS